MAVRSREELNSILEELTESRSDDRTLEILEDISDSLDDYERRAGTDWEKKYNDLDASWRERYRQRFFGGSDSAEKETLLDQDEEEKDVVEKTKFEELFKEER